MTSKIENSYCDVVGDMDTSLELGKAAEQMNDCQKMWADLQHELDHILDEVRHKHPSQDLDPLIESKVYGKGRQK